jgi:hypothetical protein
MRDRMPEGRAWIDELRQKADALDDRAQTELLLISTITAVEVGDDDSALAALDGIRGLEGGTGDPSIESAAQLATSWVLPIVDDFDGAVKAASTALDGFRERNEPFMGWAALTVGLLQMTLDQDDAARAHLTEARDLGRRFGNSWLESTARTQLGWLAVKAGDLDDARTLLVESVDARDDAELSTQTLTFSLVASAALAQANGDAPRAATALGAADGLRKRVGLAAWPSMRRNEGALVARVKQALEIATYEDAFAFGSELNRRDAVALVRGG